MRAHSVKLLLVSGSTRAASSNSAALRTASAIAIGGLVTRTYDGLSALPAFNPDDERESLPAPVAALRLAVSSADAVLFCTPEYAGALPGSFKNLLDWLVGGGELYGMPVSSINVAATGRGQAAQTALRSVLSYLGAVEVEGGFVQLPITSGDRERDGSVLDPHFRSGLDRVLRVLAAHVAGRPK